MPEGRARGACPEEALKGPRRGYGSRRPAGSAGGGGRVPSPSKKFPQIFFFLKIISEAAAGHQGVLEEGKEGGTPHKKSRQFFPPKLSLKRPQAARGCWRGGREGLPSWGPAHKCVFIIVYGRRDKKGTLWKRNVGHTGGHPPLCNCKMSANYQ